MALIVAAWPGLVLVLMGGLLGLLAVVAPTSVPRLGPRLFLRRCIVLSFLATLATFGLAIARLVLLFI
jgi:hypothetical protein